jgi:hypothetical protein
VKDFFISYTSQDRRWAEWIAWNLEEQQYSVVIQAWDFVGNWVMKMDSAMQEAERTIAVLSPHYLKAMFTQAEWANAFRLDPTGERDLLIPVRIADVEPQGVLAQIVYVDLVDRNEQEALDLLLKRIRRERGKPTVSPHFPGGSVTEGLAQRSRLIVTKPVYPAEAEDQQQFLRARDAIVHWRGIYANKIDSITAAGKLARKWSKEPPAEFNDEVAGVINMAASVAEDFRALPVSTLEFALPYGLHIHLTVIWGQAINTAIETASNFDPQFKAASEMLNARRLELGLKADSFMPSNYAFEMLARVLESAVELARFNIKTLPRGYLKDSASHIPSDLGNHRSLLVARMDNDPRLHLMSVDGEIRSIGSFSARSLPLYALCAQRNSQGSIDLIAHDFQHLYYWQNSSQLPTMQFTQDTTIQDARFLSADPGSPVALVDSHGTVDIITPNGSRKTLHRPSRQEIVDAAQIWVDPLDREAWYVLLMLRDGEVSSALHGDPASRKTAADLWNDALFRSEFDAPGSKVYWGSGGEMILATLDGLPCLIAKRGNIYRESGMCFLDPKTLLPIRRSLICHEFTGDVAIAGERWLIGALLKNDNQPRNRLLVWDLDAADGKPSGGWFEQKGDVYHVVVTGATKDSFQTLQVFRTLELPPHENFYQLVRFEWPSGEISLLQVFQSLRIWPVLEEFHS